ncbi:MAG: DUF4957 domain-containing protein [Bacteroides sp.]|uniref:DUF4992 family lipoprotein n=1 Tax=Bacteroides sp. TaxID=29523 RepID=UPI001B7821F3|nr:DUF4992 family lipoprotein [Bacteroides sp.]MBP6065699.1 DUF4957 domain-containing protein [Bacteroides sp.]MBP6067984.1 DUF4957 domain-containing protein [Bacteroides sp.]MBP8622458.1 DUF4957 domain-containing protein [Bacteroides sp.]MBP9586065.1 DUF4957 domain-containing protein [Bacteroides sp.]
MKSNHLFFRRKRHVLMVITAMLLFSSCIDGYKDDWIFSSDVRGEVLESPKAENVTFKPSPDGKLLRIQWPVVYGASGYQFSLYIVDDPNNPVVVGNENEIVDGCSVERPLRDDTKYKAVLKTLGNDKYSNKEAVASTEVNYTTLVPTYATIPQGDIAEWFINNPIPSGKEKEELAFVLEENGNYTLSAPIDFGKQKVTFRGEKVGHAKVVYGSAGRISTTAGLKIKFIDFDCKGVDGSSSDAAFLLFSSTPDETLIGKNSYYIINDPIVIQACKIEGVQRHLIYDNKKKYCPAALMISDCFVKLTTTQEQPVILFNQGFVNNLTIQNSTFWHDGPKDNNYFVQYNGSGRPTNADFVTGSVNYLNSTFYHVCYSKQWGNYNGFAGQSSVNWNMKQNIFVESGKGEVARRFLGGRTGQVTASFGQNTYWYNKAVPAEELKYDISGTHFETDPMLQDPKNGDFTVLGEGQLNARTGDPRWLPELPIQ